MTLESNKTLVRRVLDDAWHAKNIALVDELFAPNFVNHDPDAPEAANREGYKQWATGLLSAFPDLRVTIESLIAEGDQVAKRWTARGTNTGVIPGLGATGRQVTFTGVTIYRIIDGKIAECWWNRDTSGLMQQLGAVPATQA
jgi:steroid delta-isomerase-like uncharacterized protein